MTEGDSSVPQSQRVEEAIDLALRLNYPSIPLEAVRTETVDETEEVRKEEILTSAIEVKEDGDSMGTVLPQEISSEKLEEESEDEKKSELDSGEELSKEGPVIELSREELGEKSDQEFEEETEEDSFREKFREELESVREEYEEEFKEKSDQESEEESEEEFEEELIERGFDTEREGTVTDIEEIIKDVDSVSEESKEDRKEAIFQGSTETEVVAKGPEIMEPDIRETESTEASFIGDTDRIEESDVEGTIVTEELDTEMKAVKFEEIEDTVQKTVEEEENVQKTIEEEENVQKTVEEEEIVKEIEHRELVEEVKDEFEEETTFSKGIDDSSRSQSKSSAYRTS